MRGCEASLCGSETEEAEQAEEVKEVQRFRVRVCLQRFFSDERARCYVWVSASRRVRWLTRRLRRLFPRLPRSHSLALVSRGHLLPPAEPLAVLAPDDPVEVIPIAEDRHTDERNDVHELECGAAAGAGDGDEPDCGSVSVTEPTPAKRLRPAATPADTDHLLEVKRRALRLLEHVTCAAPPAPLAPPAPPAHLHTPPASTACTQRSRRRRVRRRRTPRIADATSDEDRREAGESRVSRNEGAAARSPRAVHSLKSLESPE